MQGQSRLVAAPPSVAVPFPDPVGSPSGGPWTGAFRDEFDIAYTTAYGTGPDPSVWSDRYIYGDMFRVQNNDQELEWYAHGYYGHSVADSVLSLTARFENPHTVDPLCPVPMWNGNTGLYTSGVACSFPGFAFTYGYLEARIQNTGSVNGTWPAFWLLPQAQWPPEIDIAEYNTVSNSREVDNAYDHGGTWSSTYYAEDSSYHAYGMRLDSSHVTFFRDGTQTAQFTYSDGALPWSIQLNHAVYGNTTGTGFPASYNVDYVRFWGVSGVPAQPAVTSVSPSSGIPSSGSATVSFAAVPGATTYRVTAFPSDILDDGGYASQAQYGNLTAGNLITATGSSSPITVSGLTNGYHYAFTVAAINATGYSIESAPVPALS